MIPVADGVRLAVDRWPATRTGRTAGMVAGTATPFVLVHGLASNARLWDGVASRLAALGHDAVALDLRGHGRSAKPDGSYDVATVAGDVAALIGALGLDRPVLAGQSWGGNIVLELAARRAKPVAGIACVDGGWLEPGTRFPTWEACVEALAPPRIIGRRLEELEARVRSMHPDWPETGIRGALASFDVRPDGTVRPWFTYERHLAALRGLWEHRPTALYASLEVPVLLAPADRGPGDRTERTRRSVDLAAAAIARARVRWFEGDHDIHAQHPDELAGVLHELTTDGFFS
jgi:pimeloyl-ACP methyl ester carboxylesterase